MPPRPVTGPLSVQESIVLPYLQHSLPPGSGAMAHRCSMWDPPGAEMEPVSPALAGRFFFFFLATEPPGTPADVINEQKFTREEG